MASRPKPVRVSPLIKGARWSLLICGIFAGINRKSSYECKEYRQKAFREKRIRDYNEKRMAISKQVYKELVFEFANIFGVDLPPNFEPEE